MDTSQIDQILKLQLVVAWAGEANSDPPRLGWWQTALCDEYGGEDLLRRLAPRTWQWASLQACRAAAMRVDESARRSADDADHLLSLYRLGFEADERVNERLLELKHEGIPPTEAFPDIAELLAEWSTEKLEAWLAELGRANYTTTSTGRRLKGETPADPSVAARQLAAGMLPLPEHYPLPHFRVKR